MDFQWVGLKKCFENENLWTSVEGFTWKSKILSDMLVYYLVFYISFNFRCSLISEEMMQQHNIQLKWRQDKNSILETDDSIEFT